MHEKMSSKRKHHIHSAQRYYVLWVGVSETEKLPVRPRLRFASFYSTWRNLKCPEREFGNRYRGQKLHASPFTKKLFFLSHFSREIFSRLNEICSLKRRHLAARWHTTIVNTFKLFKRAPVNRESSKHVISLVISYIPRNYVT